MDILSISLIVALVLNLQLFLVAFVYQSDKLTDISYATTFICLVAVGLMYKEATNAYLYILAAMILIWALRIGGFLLVRVIKSGRDTRFNGMREHFGKFSKFWIGQAITVWILMIPALFAFTHTTTFTPLSLLGILIWSSGLLIESVADFQKYRFTTNPANRNKWIETGIWKYSRHPNYFGEILIWIGIYAYVFTSLSTVEQFISLISPLCIIVLLLFVSGVPILEKSADKRWSHIEAYRAYKNRTNLFLPFLPRRR